MPTHSQPRTGTQAFVGGWCWPGGPLSRPQCGHGGPLHPPVGLRERPRVQHQHRRLQPLLPPPPSLTLAKSPRPSTVQGDRGPPCPGGDRERTWVPGGDRHGEVHPPGSSWHSPSTGMLHSLPLHHSHTHSQHNPSVLGETEAQSGGERGKRDRPTDPKPSPTGAPSISQSVKLGREPRGPPPWP